MSIRLFKDYPFDHSGEPFDPFGFTIIEVPIPRIKEKYPAGNFVTSPMNLYLRCIEQWSIEQDKGTIYYSMLNSSIQFYFTDVGEALIFKLTWAI